MGLQLPGPHLVGAGLGRQRRSAVGLLQVFEQDAPGHAVHHQVMDHQQQALGTVGHAHQGGAQQRALFKIEAALGRLAECGQFCVVAGVGLPQSGRGDRRGMGLLPAFGLLDKTQAQSA